MCVNLITLSSLHIQSDIFVSHIHFIYIYKYNLLCMECVLISVCVVHNTHIFFRSAVDIDMCVCRWTWDYIVYRLARTHTHAYYLFQYASKNSPHYIVDIHTLNNNNTANKPIDTWYRIQFGIFLPHYFSPLIITARKYSSNKF